MANTLYDALFAPLAQRDDTFLFLPDGTEISGGAFHALIGRQANALVAAGVHRATGWRCRSAKSPEALALYAGVR